MPPLVDDESSGAQSGTIRPPDDFQNAANSAEQAIAAIQAFQADLTTQRVDKAGIARLQAQLQAAEERAEQRKSDLEEATSMIESMKVQGTETQNSVRSLREENAGLRRENEGLKLQLHEFVQSLEADIAKLKTTAASTPLVSITASSSTYSPRSDPQPNQLPISDTARGKRRAVELPPDHDPKRSRVESSPPPEDITGVSSSSNPAVAAIAGSPRSTTQPPPPAHDSVIATPAAPNTSGLSYGFLNAGQPYDTGSVTPSTSMPTDIADYVQAVVDNRWTNVKYRALVHISAEACVHSRIVRRKTPVWSNGRNFACEICTSAGAPCMLQLGSSAPGQPKRTVILPLTPDKRPTGAGPQDFSYWFAKKMKM